MQWQQLDRSGEPVTDGVSFALHDASGKIEDLTVFVLPS
jgi:hypothetical protein